MKSYTHPHPKSAHVMRTYRHYLVGQKRVWMSGGRGRRCLRGLIHYRALVDEYLAAKRITLNGGALQP